MLSDDCDRSADGSLEDHGSFLFFHNYHVMYSSNWADKRFIPSTTAMRHSLFVRHYFRTVALFNNNGRCSFQIPLCTTRPLSTEADVLSRFVLLTSALHFSITRMTLPYSAHLQAHLRVFIPTQINQDGTQHFPRQESQPHPILLQKQTKPYLPPS